MKIGDKVRFLNDVGGGVISGFQGKDIVLVKDEDGFELPTLVKECIVIDTDDYNIEKKAKDGAAPDRRKGASPVDDARPAAEEEESDPADSPVAYRPKPQERRGGEELNLLLGFVPVNAKELSTTDFEAYIINDCNYAISFAICAGEGGNFRLWHEGKVEPNTKLFLDEFGKEELPGMEKIMVQAIAYKTTKDFAPKPPIGVSLKLDGTKFYKLHSFQPSDFFETPALVIPIVKNDRAVCALDIDSEQIASAMSEPNHTESHNRAARQPARKAKSGNGPLEIDLHASEILETTAGLEPKDILDYQLKTFREVMDENLKKKGKRIVFIHGKGDGVLRQSLLRELKRHYKSCRSQDASFQEYGFGATMVTIG